MSQNRLGFATISRGAETQPRAAALHGDAPRLRSTFILACGLPVLRHTSSDFAQHWPSPSHLNLRSSFAVGDLSNSKNLLVAPHAVDRDEDAWKLYVFRKSRHLLSTRSLLQQLRAELHCLGAGPGPQAIEPSAQLMGQRTCWKETATRGGTGEVPCGFAAV